MLYSTLGDTGLIVSRLAFGAMTFGQGKGKMAAIYKLGQNEADAIVSTAIDAGVNFFNTADIYAGGDSEVILGKALGSRRRDMIIATKAGNRVDAGLNNWGLSRRHLIASCEASLRRLGTDYIDVYLAHRQDRLTPLDEQLAAFEELVRSGKVRYTGFSNWPAWYAAKAIALQKERGYSPFRAAEVYYSLVGREIEQDIIPMAADAGTGLIIWSPLASGYLTGKYPADGTPGGGRMDQLDVLPIDRAQAETVLVVMRDVAGRHGGATLAQVALAWLLAKPVASVIIGATSLAQLHDNLAAADLALTAADMAQLDAVSAGKAIYPNWLYKGEIAEKTVETALGARAQ
jgi:aryl-alcohol dehydrogenase-like predicted oxidoreductase